jgi:predicted secreted hydrolase
VAGLLLTAACGDEVVDNRGPLVGMRISSVLGEVQDSGFLKADTPRQFVFPADHGLHPGFRSEWWYLTAVLEDSEGREFGMQYTLFKQALSPAPTGTGSWHTGLAFMAHLALTDVSGKGHLHEQRFARGHPKIAGVTTQPSFRAWLDDWVLQDRGQQLLDLQLQARASEFDVNLRLQQQQPVVLQGEQGLSRKGEGSASYYYSMPRLEVSGAIQSGGRTHQVTGLAWLDREWSTSVLPDGVAGWDWFALQFFDRTSLMAFRLRRQDGLRDVYDHGMWIPAPVRGEVLQGEALQGEVLQSEAGPTAVLDDKASVLTRDDFLLTPTRFWTDRQGVSWPVSWLLDVQGQQYSVNALVDDQVMDAGFVYWEGIVGVQDGDGRDVGRGYMELTGYDAVN